MVRLNFCAGSGILLAVASVVLLVFTNIGQLNTSTIPRHLRIVSISTAGVGTLLGGASDIYNSASSYTKDRSVNGTGDGLRRTYEWGVWNYCATDGSLGTARSYCTKRGFGYQFRPATAIESDVASQYQPVLDAALPSNVFTDEKYLARFTQAANYLIFIGSILAALAMLVGFGAHRFAFLFGAVIALLAFLALAVGAVIWTILISRVKAAINGATANGVSLGITVAYGNGLWLLWGATGAALLAVMPYLIACCTGRHESRDTY